MFRKSMLLFVGFLSCTCVNALTIATINMNEILQSQQVQARLKSEFDKTFSSEERQFRKDVETFQAEAQTYHQNAVTMSNDEKVKQEKKLIQEEKRLAQRQQGLQSEQVRLHQRLIEHIKEIAKTLAKENGFDLVAPQQAFFYIKDPKDITDQVLKKL